MKKLIIATLLGAAVAGTAFAHEGVKNEAVKKRMMLMDGIKNATGALGAMAKGEMEFDAGKAAMARQALIDGAAATPAAFMANEMDPKSTAKPAIWENWADFETKAMALGTASEALDASSLDGVRAGMGGIGGSCQACHKEYRVKK